MYGEMIGRFSITIMSRDENTILLEQGMLE